jgi:ADP-ribose pyrophosphatase
MEVLMGTFNTPGVSDQHTTIFLATGLTPCPTERAGVEEGFMTVETISLDDVDALVADGTLVDETTVLGLYLARRRLAGVEPGS